jgi:hypothetical protein
MYDFVVSYAPYVLSILLFWLVTFALGALSVIWKNRGLIGARVPWLCAAFEFLNVIGFTPTSLAQWVTRRSWYLAARRSALDSLGDTKPPSLIPSLAVLVLVGSALVSCGGAAALSEGSVCPLSLRPNVEAVLVLARAAVSYVSASCGDDCPAEVGKVSSVLKTADATLADVCDAVTVAKQIPCVECQEKVDAVSSLAGCAP